jgi:Ca-activated chloride channel family protein
MLTSFIAHFHFLRPWWWLAVIPLVFFLLSLRRRLGGTHHWEQVCDSHLLPYLLEHSPGASLKQISVLLAAGWLLAIFALAGPTWQQLPQAVYAKNTGRVLVMDLSENVRAADLLPSRLVRARYKLLDILHASKEGQTGLIVYSGEPYLVSPLTEDTNTIASLVPDLSPSIIPTQGNDLAAALKMAAKLLRQSGLEKGQIVVLAASSPSEDAINVAKQLAEQGITTSVLGVGTGRNAPMTLANGQYVTDKKGAIVFSHLNMDNLQQLAQAGRGSYVVITDNSNDVNTLLQSTDFNTTALTASEEKVTTNLWKDEGHWFIWLLLPLAVVAFRRGWFGGR